MSQSKFPTLHESLLEPDAGPPEERIRRRVRVKEGDPGIEHLYEELASYVSTPASTVLTFAGPEGGEGTTTIAREFVARAAAELGKPVLFVSFGPSRQDGWLLYHVDRSHANPLLIDSLGGATPSTPKALKALLGRGVAALDHPEQATSAYALLIAPRSVLDQPAATLQRNRARSVLLAAKGLFPLVVVDSPPIKRVPQALFLCAASDGVVLVLEADRTRQPVAAMVKERIALSGAAVLGVIMNKSRRRRGFLSRLFSRA